MRRRTLLATLPAAALAGCTGDPPSGGGGGAPTATAARGDLPFDDIGCPSFADGVDETVCAHTAGQTGAVLDPAAYVFEDDPDDGEPGTLDVVVRNRSGERLEWNPYDWSLHRRAGEGWVYEGPDAVPEPLTYVDPGGTFRYRLATAELSSTGGADRPVVVDLEPGSTYAFSITVQGNGRTTELVAPFEYVATE